MVTHTFTRAGFAATLAAASLLSGCATPPGQEVEPQAASKKCVPVTGSNLCRSPGSSGPSNVSTVSGEDLRRNGGSITGPTGTTIGN